MARNLLLLALLFELAALGLLAKLGLALICQIESWQFL
jgi:hypothetical protein